MISSITLGRKTVVVSKGNEEDYLGTLEMSILALIMPICTSVTTVRGFNSILDKMEV